MALVEADVASADFEAGLAAAHAEVGRLEALLVAEKVKVNWYHRAIRRQEAAPPVAAEEAKRVENAKERKEEKQAAALLDAAKAVPPMAVEEAATPVAAEEAGHVENAGPARKVRKNARGSIPADKCPACWNEDRGVQAGGRHFREFRSCRLHFKS